MDKSIDIATCFPGFKLWLLIQNQARDHIYKNDEGTHPSHRVTMGLKAIIQNHYESPGHTKGYLDYP